MAKYFRLLIVVLLLGSCAKDDVSVFNTPTLELDARLPIDSNGYYHLVLNTDTNQTIHTISGTAGNTLDLEPIKVSWSSNLTWIFNGEVVPTVNAVSYPNEYGKIHTVVAPISSMKNDTLTVTATINEWNVSQTLNIVLE